MNQLHAAAAAAAALRPSVRLGMRTSHHGPPLKDGRHAPLLAMLLMAAWLAVGWWLPRTAHASSYGDALGQVARVQVAADGKLWFAMEFAPATTYCKQGWFNMNLYVPADHPQYPYYYALLVTAVSKGKNVMAANLDWFDGSGPCDVTKTGFGLVLTQ